MPYTQCSRSAHQKGYRTTRRRCRWTIRGAGQCLRHLFARAIDVTRYIAEHKAGPPRGKPRGIDRLERFDDLEEAKRACDRWQRSECTQAIVDTSTGQRWIRIDDDREWNHSQPSIVADEKGFATQRTGSPLPR